LNQIEQFEIDKSSNPQFLQTNIEEFNRLNKSVEKLILKNRTIYNNQREFIENAAHELQTPLAIFQGKLDLLIQGTELTNEQSKILNSLNKSVSKLNRLNKNLLLLSKIENNSFTNQQKLNLSTLLKKNFAFFSEQAKAKKLSISTEIDESLSIETDPILAEILINNLFLNAIRHNIPNGAIHISANNETLIFSNTGSAKPLEQSKLFTRFSKSNPSSEGNGLGLYIVEKIASLNNWTLSYSFSNELHIFSITF
jgi:signal transduction histidine kinase